MHKLSPVHIAASVVMALAGTSAFAEGAKAASTGSATAATNASVSGTTIGTTGSRIDITPQIQTALPTNTLKSIDGGTPATGITLTNTSKTDVRNEQTLKATQGTRSSGTTSTSTSTGGGTSGTTASSGTRTAGSSSVNSTGTISGTSDVTGTNTIATPVLVNGIAGSSFESDRVADERAMASAQYVQANGVTMQPVVTDTARAGASIDRVVRQAQRDRSKIGRNGQLLHSIAPRTKVDRSNEMPDDGPSPALTGPLAR